MSNYTFDEMCREKGITQEDLDRITEYLMDVNRLMKEAESGKSRWRQRMDQMRAEHTANRVFKHPSAEMPELPPEVNFEVFKLSLPEPVRKELEHEIGSLEIALGIALEKHAKK